MNKTFKLYGIIFIIVMVLLVILEMGKSEVVDWRKNYDTSEKSPFGLYVFDQEIPKLLNNKLEKVEKSPYDYYQDGKKYEPQNILLINQDVDEESWKKVLKMLDAGSDVLIISDGDLVAVSDTLKAEFGILNYEDSNTLNFTDEKLKNDSLVLDKFPNKNGFVYIPKEIEILGSSNSVDGIGANFIKYNVGKGHIYYHTEPLFLTNYYLLQPNAEKYLQNVFSYLPNRKTIWFTAETQGDSSSPSPLSFIIANPPLKYAWYLLLAGLLLFIFFNAKRKQRIIPIIKPLENKSVEFVKSIGNLYLQEGDIQNMMAKKAQYFLHKLRTDFYLETKNLDEDFIKKLQLKTGKSHEKIKEAVSFLIRAQNPYAIVNKEDLMKMNSLLDEILK